MAHTIDCVCSRILNHGSNHGLSFSRFKFFGWKNILNQLENSWLNCRFLLCLIFQFYLMYRLICQKPAHFLSAQMALVSTFFQMFIVLGIYNFASVKDYITTSLAKFRYLKTKKKYGRGKKWTNGNCCKVSQVVHVIFHFDQIWFFWKFQTKWNKLHAEMS